VKDLRTLHAALVAEYRFRTDMLNQERVFSIVTRYTSSAHAAKMKRINQVVRAKANKTSVSADEFVEYSAQVPAP